MRFLLVLLLQFLLSLISKDSPAQQPLPGTYQFNQAPLRLYTVAQQKGKWILRSTMNATWEIRLKPVSGGKYRLEGIKPVTEIQFDKDTLKVVGAPDQKGVRIYSSTTLPVARKASNRQNGFTRRDTLRGMLTPLRSCYDVTYYHLTADIDPAEKMVTGNTLIRFKALQSFNRFQIDLYENMVTDSILFHQTQLHFTREYDAVFVDLPQTIQPLSTEEIRVYYHGNPQEPDQNSPMNGGFFWRKDASGKPLVQVICQGSGASLWWPNKDHLSDEPDSVLLSVTVPAGLQNISNGRLRRTAAVEGNRTLSEWFVSYPINNYNINVCIGDFVHFSDLYVRNGDTLTLAFYCLPNHLELARELAGKVKPMLAEYEKYFGPYPFPRDGFKLMETLYPMEHQSAVGLGLLKKDSTELIRLLWHETAHEWWGNNVSCSDMADFWLHEAFATYAERMMIEKNFGKEAVQAALKEEEPANKEPLIGVRDVNHIFYALWDVYSKGCRVVHTLRSVMDDDDRFFEMLRGIQQQFRLKTVTSQEICSYISEKSGLDLTAFFDQYLLQTSVPELQVELKEEPGGVRVAYRWSNVVKGFRMPVKVTTAKDAFTFIHPDENRQELFIKNLKAADFKVDESNFYITIKPVVF